MSTLVYSTETGRIKPQPKTIARPKGDGIVRISRQTSGRKGNGVSLITGLDLDDIELKKLAKTLKQRCGCGGTVKNGVIEIQSDNRELLKSYLESQNYQVKIAGG
ncbi:stress response translation initiation inhibitor YciH [Actinobacillus delphinicola]|uniref:Translation initiation factor Sui1 n=1 Tax=Actinobacillus delphinicola TaxID=51161 RepID=A0A448TSA5_9PAST|nr:stress response translation initiation inhibitor YciH [Actinobacillus delphinicola]VEJ08924.1 translation initiation factor Sui1 [Actinobacillus delphinicola]